MTTRYEYRALTLSAIFGLMTFPRHRDYFVADDSESQAYAEVIAGGFRWVRTEGDYAIFERTVQAPDANDMVNFDTSDEGPWLKKEDADAFGVAEIGRPWFSFPCDGYWRIAIQKEAKNG